MEEGEKIKEEEISEASSPSALFLNPQEIIDSLEILPGMSVAHFGCGTGVFTFPIAKKIGSEGRVWALDVLGYKIDMVNSQAKNIGLNNIIVKQVNLEGKNGSGLEEESVDWVIIVNMLHQNKKKNHILEDAVKILKEKGRILFIDWKVSNNAIGPDKEIRISHEDLIKLVRKNGLGIIKELEISRFYFGAILTR